MLVIGTRKEKQLQSLSAREEVNSLTYKMRPNPKANPTIAG